MEKLLSVTLLATIPRSIDAAEAEAKLRRSEIDQSPADCIRLWLTSAIIIVNHYYFCHLTSRWH